LSDVFGYTAFRPGQFEIIDAVMAGRDGVGVMPTGAGKSVTYQIPARLLGGVTLVVSPLISLMKDQVDSMTEVGIRATYLNSSLEPVERSRRIAALKAGQYEIVYAAPEGIDGSIGRILETLRPSAHCGGRSPLHQRVGPRLSPVIPQPTRASRAASAVSRSLALTATATHRVKDDIAGQLALRDPLIIRGSFFRPNLRLHADRERPRDRRPRRHPHAGQGAPR
jgi:ATP-dependent DNA helicase RecQ